ncbi:MAG: GIY-YIG nuclease family protein [Dysgonamonadaceae bacterium]|jgi:putative endonuclease|nr:GIY-YIG nuclease family protein [Dysgonamonadaceae bacterium]
MYYFYVIYSKKLDRFYIGATADLTDRLRRHNSKHKKGFTGTAQDWEVVYSEHFASKEAAFAREREVKAWKSRERLARLVQSTPS